MIKLKELIKENIGGMVSIGSIGSPLVTREEKASIEEAPDYDLAKKLNGINNDIFKTLLKYKNKADVDKAIHSWMLGLHASLKKAGYKI